MLNIFLQAAPAAQGGGGGSMLIMLLLMFLVMWLFMIRPQRKQQKQLEEMRKNLKKGDKIVTVGGIYGTVAETDERTVLVKVDGDVKLRFDKSAIQMDMTDAANQVQKTEKTEKK